MANNAYTKCSPDPRKSDPCTFGGLFHMKTPACNTAYVIDFLLYGLVKFCINNHSLLARSLLKFISSPGERTVTGLSRGN